MCDWVIYYLVVCKDYLFFQGSLTLFPKSSCKAFQMANWESKLSWASWEVSADKRLLWHFVYCSDPSSLGGYKNCYSAKCQFVCFFRAATSCIHAEGSNSIHITPTVTLLLTLHNYILWQNGCSFQFRITWQSNNLRKFIFWRFIVYL